MDDVGELIDRLPYGVVVLERRTVAAANPAAARLVGELDRERRPAARCHELFACRAPGGPCQTGCLVARAARGDAPLPEIRIDTSPGAAASALWVTAAPLDGEDRVLLHLRAGDARDRRRRSEPHWLTGPELRISALGRTWVDSREGPIGGRWLQQRPGLVLKYLVCERDRVVHAEEIAEALWPGAGRQGINTVRHFMHALRRRLEPDRPKGADSSFVVTVQGGGYALDRRRVKIDADELEAAAREGAAAAARGDEDEALARLGHGVALYRGDFLADEPFADWVWDERRRLQGLAAEALRGLVRLRRARGELAEAADALERLAELEPYDVDTHKALLGALGALGRRTDAARRYAAFKTRMARDFDEEPGFALREASLDALP